MIATLHNLYIFCNTFKQTMLLLINFTIWVYLDHTIKSCGL